MRSLRCARRGSACEMMIEQRGDFVRAGLIAAVALVLWIVST
jgi:hypothetical protein